MKRSVAVVVVVLAAAGAMAQMPFGQDRQLLPQFDADKNGRLNADERKAARAWLAANPGGGFPGAPGGFPGFRGGGPPGGRGGFPGGPGRFGGRGGVEPSPGARLTPASVKPAGNAALYDTGTLRTLFLQFDAPDWEQELSDFSNTDVDVPATVIVDGRTYREVGVHFRGLSSLMMAGPGQKRSLNLSFDFADEDQRIMGVRTLNLLNSAGDPSFIRPVLYAEIAGRYLPTPKANFMRVVINGESWGVYVNAEQFNSDFVRDRFKTARGARWKVPGSPMGGGGLAYRGEDAAGYRQAYEIRSRDEAESWSALIALTRTLDQTPLDRLEAALAPMLNIDGVLRFLALEVALVNSDGYWSRGSDYSLYRDDQGRFHVIPHDINEGMLDEGGARFGGPGLPPGFDPAQLAQFFGRGAPGGGPPAGFPPLPPGGGGRGGFPGGFPGGGGPELDPLVGLDRADLPLRSKLLKVPALQKRYLGYVREIADQWLDWNRLGPIVARHRALIEADVRADTRKLFGVEAFEAALGDGEASLRGFVDKRRAYLLKTITP